MYKIFIGEGIVYLAASEHLSDAIRLCGPKVTVHAWSPGVNIKSFIILELVKGEHIIHSDDFDELTTAFLEPFEIVLAAGGLVVSDKKQVLMIHRKGRWDLPKGKRDDCEPAETNALREVEEETGVEGLQIVSPILFEGLRQRGTMHCYKMGGRWNLKMTFWYLMKGRSDSALRAQREEDIRVVDWVDKEDIPERLRNTFPSIEDVAAAAGYA